MPRRRQIVAFQAIESPQDRVFRLAAQGATVDEVLQSRPIRRDTYWCAADKPATCDTFRVTPVYRTNEVPEDACCETCGIGIRELQELMATSA